MLLPALIATPLRKIAEKTATDTGTRAGADRFERLLGALAGRQLSPGGWAAGARHADAEPLCTLRDRSYDESTVRKAARELSANGAVTHAARQLEAQVQRAVGGEQVTAFTDLYDQVYWTKKPAWAGPVGSLGNRVLACTYFGLTFVKVHDGPTLAYAMSWHKPASPLRDPLEALHAQPRRHRWLFAHVRVHILDRGTQGDPTLRWAWLHGIPYLTLSNGTAHWRRFQKPTHHTATGVPIFLRPDARLADCDGPRGAACAPRVLVFPAHPEAGSEDGRALRYRLAADLADAEVCIVNEVYKARWPSNENPIKALVAVGFDRNLDRTLDATSSRGHDGKVRRAHDDLAALDAKIAELMPRPFREFGREYVKLTKRREAKAAKLAALEADGATKGARSDRGGEHLCKLLALLLFNALTLLLWRSPLTAVRVLTPALVRDLLLSRSAMVTHDGDVLRLAVTALPDPTDRAYQEELVRLVNTARLRTGGKRLALRLRDPPAICQELRLAA